MKETLYIGLMSGTSMDAIDGVLVAVDGAGLRALHVHSEPYTPELNERLGKAIANKATPDEIGRLDRLTGEAFAQCALGLLQATSTAAASVRAIGSHGQTLRHAPDGPSGFSLQIGNPSVIAERTGITTVADFRSRDVAAGGQGAPLVPAFHSWMFGTEEEPRAVVNLGGIANVSLIAPRSTKSAQSLSGFDTGPANTLLDNWCLSHLGQPYDKDGLWARTGRIVPALLEQMLGDPYFRRPAPKSSGREYFNMEWLGTYLDKCAPLAPEDVQRTLLELTARSVADALGAMAGAQVYLCGGGSRNRFLLERLGALMPDRPPQTTAQLGLAPEAVEGAAFAWLAMRTLEGLPGNSPESTGARGPRILGGIYPAS